MPYEMPTAAALKALYPAFDAVADATVDAHLANAAATGVDTSWLEADYQPAVSALAAHNLAMLGLGAETKAQSMAREGVTSFRSGSYQASFDGERAKASAGGEYSATVYGQEYERLLRKNRGGPRVIGAGASLAGGASPVYPPGGTGLIP